MAFFMKDNIKTLVLAAISAAAVANTAHAQQTLAGLYTTGDLLAGFTTQSGNDAILNLGLVTSLANGQSWDITSLLGTSLPSNFGNFSTVQWGVVGANGAFGYGTGSPGTIAALGTLNGIKTTLTGLGGTVGASGFGTPASSASGDGSWNNGTVVVNPSTFRSAWYNPNSTGNGTVNFSQVQDNGSAPTQLNPGTFTLAVNGSGDEVLTYGTVPEPSVAALGGIAGLIGLWARNRKKFA
jgi:hypothetical protein